MDISVNVWKKDEEYVANCPELEIFCYGSDEEQARVRLKKVISFYAETASDLGYNVDLDGLSTSTGDIKIEQRTTGKKRTSAFS